jgi:hypothetical protein
VLRSILPAWEIGEVVGEAATKSQLSELLGPAVPAFLFTATHGVAFRRDDPRLFRQQGALLCSEWTRLGVRQPIPQCQYFSADDVVPDARLRGSVVFHFACYSAGTPALDDYPHERGLRRPEYIAPQPFVAALPRRLLAHEAGGAGAVIAHVERAWACSFVAGVGLPRLGVFQTAIRQLLEGYPVGAAMESFNSRYAALAVDLAHRLMPFFQGEPLSSDEQLQLARLWTLHNDARGYVVLGDPAVRIRTGPG